MKKENHLPTLEIVGNAENEVTHKDTGCYFELLGVTVKVNFEVLAFQPGIEEAAKLVKLLPLKEKIELVELITAKNKGGAI